LGLLALLALFGASNASAQESLIEVPTEIDGEVDTWWEAILAGLIVCDTPDTCELYKRVSKDTYMGSLISKARVTGNTAAEILGVTQEEFDAAFERILRDNAVWLEARIDRAGWFDIESSGPDTDEAAFIIVQRSDYDVSFQKKTLAVLTDLLDEKKTSPQNVAYLTDRVARAMNVPQTYGTQGRCVKTGLWKPNEIVDPDMVEARRAEIGLEPLKAYAESISKNCP